MPKARSARTGRGSPQAIEKRRVARLFNDLLVSTANAKLDGRSDRRRERLLAELGRGSAYGDRKLKPLDVLNHVNELLELGEPLASIKKVRKFPRPLPVGKDTIALVRRFKKAYGFPPEVYRFVGISQEALRRAKVG